MPLEGFKAFDFRVGALVLGSDLGDVAIDEFAEQRALRFNSGDEDATVHFAFDHARPGLGIGFGFEGLALG